MTDHRQCSHECHCRGQVSLSLSLGHRTVVATGVDADAEGGGGGDGQLYGLWAINEIATQMHVKDPHLVATWSLAMACDAINLAGLLIGRPSPGPFAFGAFVMGNFMPTATSRLGIVEQTRKAHNTALWERNLCPCWPPQTERESGSERIKDGNNFENEKKKEICYYMSEHA